MFVASLMPRLRQVHRRRVVPTGFGCGNYSLRIAECGVARSDGAESFSEQWRVIEGCRLAAAKTRARIMSSSGVESLLILAVKLSFELLAGSGRRQQVHCQRVIGSLEATSHRLPLTRLYPRSSNPLSRSGPSVTSASTPAPCN